MTRIPSLILTVIASAVEETLMVVSEYLDTLVPEQGWSRVISKYIRVRAVEVFRFLILPTFQTTDDQTAQRGGLRDTECAVCASAGHSPKLLAGTDVRRLTRRVEGKYRAIT